MLIIITWNPDPVIIDLGFYELRWYSLLFAFGFILGYQILQSQFKSLGKAGEDLIGRLIPFIVVATIFGARIAHCLFYQWDYYSQHILEIFLPFSFEPEFRFTGFLGLASHGGIFAIVIAVVIFSRMYKVSALWLFDHLAVVGALAGACIRFGNLMNSEIVGKPTDVPWAFVFVSVDLVPRHPGQLYEALAYLFIFGFLFTLQRKNQRKDGFIFGLFFVLLFLSRFLIEFLKADQSEFEAGMILNMGQILSIPFIVFGMIMMYRSRATKIQQERLPEQGELDKILD